MDTRIEIITGKACPYCGGQSVFVDSSEVYNRSYGMIYLCRPCMAYCGVHKETENSLGRLADYDLREAKKKAHAHFDPLWNKAIRLGRSKGSAKSAAYKWLSKELGIAPEFTHMGMMDIETCNKVIKICKPYLK